MLQTVRQTITLKLLKKIEVGIALKGSEVKSLRFHKANITESYIIEKYGEMWIQNLHIPKYKFSAPFIKHDPIRLKKLLLHKKQIKKLIGILQEKSIAIIALSLYFNDKNKAKLTLAVARGKKKHDKRETIKKREWERRKAQIC